MTFEVVPTNSREEWLAARRKGIGASDIAGIMGISPWTTPFQVWASKVSDLPEVMDDEAMRWGRLLEGLILDEWGRRNWEVVKRGQLIRDTERPWILATPDGFTVNHHGPVVVEAKNTTDWSWSEPPAHYQAQVQWQLIVTGYPVGYLAVLHAGRALVTYEIEADADTQARMVEVAAEFWKYVEANEPPPVQWEDSAMMAQLWPTSTDEIAEIAPDDALELFDARDARDAGNERYEAAVASVKAQMGEADTAVCDQTVVATWKTNRNGVRTFKVKGDQLG